MDHAAAPPIRELIRCIDAAVTRADEPSICSEVKTALQTFTAGGAGSLDPGLTQVTPGSYGRRLLHRDPSGRYSVVVMTWGPGQGTPIHDHAGMWCVECVYQGRIRVVSYDVVEQEGTDRMRFDRRDEVMAGVGEAGSLIPPFDYHVIDNPGDAPAVTLHVYGGEMEQCGVFLPDDTASGWHRRQTRALSYSP